MNSFVNSFVVTKLVRLLRSTTPAQSGRAKQQRAASRRLAIETMECRAMLSAMPLQLDPLGDVLEAKPSLTIMPSRDTPTSNQGGFVSMRFDDDGASLDATNSARWERNTGTFQLNGLPVKFYDSNAMPQGMELGFSGSDFTFVGLEGNDLPPAVIGAEQHTNIDTSPPGAPNVAEFTPAPIDPTTGREDQGGSISIGAIAAALTSPSESGSPGRAWVNSPVHTGSNESTALLASPTLADDTISGEWARAIAFETVSIDAAERSSTTGAETLSTRLEREVADRVPSESKATATSEDAVVHEESHGVEKVPTDRLGDANHLPLMQIARAMAGPWVTLLAPIAVAREIASVSGPTSMSRATEQPSTAANAEAFSEWAPEGAHEAQGLVERTTDIWNLTPLLVVLALDRMASGNSRRAQHSMDGSQARPTLES